MNIFVLIAVIVTCIIWLPFGQFLISVGKTIVSKVKLWCFGIKEERLREPRLLDTHIRNQFSSQQAMEKQDGGDDKEVSDRQAEEEEKYQYQKVENKHRKNEEDVLDIQGQNVKNWGGNRQNPETPASKKKPYRVIIIKLD